MAAIGIKRVMRNYRAVIHSIEQKKTESALYAVLSQGAALAQAMTPIDTNNLKNSQYSPQIQQWPGKSVGQVGYTAAYAAAVHSAPGILKGLPRAHFGKTRSGVEFGGGSQQGTYWSPNAEPGFLTKGFEELKPIIPRILEAEYRV